VKDFFSERKEEEAEHRREGSSHLGESMEDVIGDINQRGDRGGGCATNRETNLLEGKRLIFALRRTGPILLKGPIFLKLDREKGEKKKGHAGTWTSHLWGKKPTIIF